MEKRLINAKDLADYIGTSRDQIYQMVSRRQLPFVKIGKSTRFDLRDIEKWISDRKTKPLEIEV